MKHTRDLLSCVLIVCGVYFLAGCSAFSKQKKLDNRSDAAVVKVDNAYQAKLALIADKQEQIKYDLAQPDFSKTIPVADQLADLTLQLTGPATTSQAVLEKQVQQLLSSARENAQVIAQMSSVIQRANTTVVETKKDRDEIAKERNAYAEANALQADKMSKLWDVVYALIALGLVVFGLWVFEKWGQAAATIAAKVP